MPFRSWFYLVNVGGTVLWAIVSASVLALVFAPANSVIELIYDGAMSLLVPLCVAGAFMGILMATARELHYRAGASLRTFSG